MERKIRVGAVSYLNTKPLLRGIQDSSIIQEIELHIDYPSRVASMLLDDKIDIGLVPVAIIPLLKEYHIDSNFCIGCDGPVASVCLFSEQPLENVKRVLLDYQSRTSVQLVKVLLKEYWHLSPELVDAKEDFRGEIKGNTAAVVIGDRSLEQRKISPYIYDLGEVWKKMTGLPFVFAAWISNKKLPEGFIKRFDDANADGIKKLGPLLKELRYEKFDLKEYYTRYIQYNLDEAKRKGLALFLSKL